MNCPICNNAAELIGGEGVGGEFTRYWGCRLCGWSNMRSRAIWSDDEPRLNAPSESTDSLVQINDGFGLCPRCCLEPVRHDVEKDHFIV